MLKNRINQSFGRRVEDIVQKHLKLRGVARTRKYMEDLIKDMKRKEAYINNLKKYYFPILYERVSQIVELVESQKAKQIILLGRDATIILPLLREMKKSSKYPYLENVEIHNVDFSRLLKEGIFNIPFQETRIEFIDRLFKYFRVNDKKLNKTMFVDTGYEGSIIDFINKNYLNQKNIKIDMDYNGLILQDKIERSEGLRQVADNIMSLSGNKDDISVVDLIEELPKNRLPIGQEHMRVGSLPVKRDFGIHSKRYREILNYYFGGLLMKRIRLETRKYL